MQAKTGFNLAFDRQRAAIKDALALGVKCHKPGGSMQLPRTSLRVSFLAFLSLLTLSCDRPAPDKPAAEVRPAPAAPAAKTLQVLQYNVKQGKPGQTCCWGDPAIRAREQAFIVDEMTNQGVDLASLIESDNQVNGVYDCSSLDDLLGQKVSSLATSCTLCPYGSFQEALHLVWNTANWSLVKAYDPGDTCFADSHGPFKGRPFSAALLRNVHDKSEIVFIGVHPGHPSGGSGNQDFENGAKPVWDAYNQLVSAGSNNPKLIISGDFNLGCSTAAQQITNSSNGAVSIDASQCSNPPKTCCYDSGFAGDYDHVFTNLPSAKVATVIPATYTGPFTPKSSPKSESEEHKPAAGAITY